MKTSSFLIITVFLLLWESFLGFVRPFVLLDFFAGFSIIIFLLRKGNLGTFLYWLFFVGILLDLIIGRWLGISVISIIVPLIVLSLLDLVIKVFEPDRRYFTLLLFTGMSQLIMYSIAVMNGGRIDIFAYIVQVLVNLIVVVLLDRLLKAKYSEDAIKV